MPSSRLISFTDLPRARPTLCLPQCSDDLLRSVSLPSHPDLLAEKLQTRSILTLHLVSFQGVRSPPPSPEAQELSRHLVDVINAYQADHPHMSPLDVRQAVGLTQQAVPGGHKLAIKATLIGLVVILGLVAFAFLRLRA